MCNAWKERVNDLNDFLVPNQYGDQIVTICLPWQKDKTHTTEYIPKSYTADEIVSYTNMDLITYN